jgi:methionyl-tRNA formyltransferase
MGMRDLRIVFMGTPEFAVATLGSLLINGYDVACVVTAPDKPAGRGRKITKSAVKEFAESSSLPVLQPANLKDPEFIKTLKLLHADLFIVVAFRMLPQVIWKLPSIGTINLHASLLPDYRGAAPINHAIINGETVTGVTTFFIDEKIDTGSILLTEEVPIFSFDNAGILHDRLMKLGARLMIRTIEGISNNSIKPKPQSQFLSPEKIPKPAPKINPEDCIINWNTYPVKIHNFIRGLSPHPCARSYFKKDQTTLLFKVFESQPIHEKHDYNPGEIISDGVSFIRIACMDGFISIESLQLEGRKRMNPVEFLRGFKISDYNIIN